MPEYKYGTYGEIVESIYNPGDVVETVPVYIGTAPVNLVKGWRDKGLVNRPVKIKGLTDAQNNYGYCADWANYTLCEAIAAHYDSGEASVGPIYAINVLDPDAHKADESRTETLSFANGKALILGADTIVDSIAIKRPLGDVKPFGYLKEVADCETAFKESFGKNVTGKVLGDQVFYYYFGPNNPADKSKNYLLEIDINGKKYGILNLGKDLKSTDVLLYASLKLGDHDFIDGKPAKDVYDLSSYTGDAVLTLYECTATDLKTYPTDLVPIESVTLHFDKGDSPQYYELGEDYELSYNAIRGGVVIQDLTGAMAGAPEATYDVVDPSKITTADIIGEQTPDGRLTGIAALKLLFMEDGSIPNLLAAPGWSDKPEVCEALSVACRKINGHWDAMYVVDMPIEDNGDKIDTMDKALRWKEAHGVTNRPGATSPYNDERSKVCWPQAIDSYGRVFHISTLCVVQMLKTDQANGGYPYETPGNKTVPIIKQFFGEESRNGGFDQRESDAICSKGITTVIPWATTWQLWGDHTAAYDIDDEELDPRAIFDVSIRMLMHITNSFQREWALTIDKPMTRNLIDTIVNREQEKLDQLVSMGALIGKPTVAFNEEDNSTSDLMNGNFTWQIQVTPTPPLKSATVKVAYTDEGFTAYWGEE